METYFLACFVATIQSNKKNICYKKIYYTLHRLHRLGIGSCSHQKIYLTKEVSKVRRCCYNCGGEQNINCL